jgi:hypothetical protein
MSLKLAGHAIDVRVSTLPSSSGERVVMRLLDKDRGLKSLDEIGFSDTMLTNTRQTIAKSHGILLVGFVFLTIRLLILLWQVATGQATGFRHIDEVKESMHLAAGIEQPGDRDAPGQGVTR